MVYRVSCPVKLPNQLCHETFLTGSCPGWTTRLDSGPQAKLESPSRVAARTFHYALHLAREYKYGLRVQARPKNNVLQPRAGRLPG
jgi:hypothetical protein